MFLVPSVVVLLLGVLLLTNGEAIIEGAKALWPDTPQGEVDDVEGYAMIAGMIGTGLGGLAGFCGPAGRHAGHCVRRGTADFERCCPAGIRQNTGAGPGLPHCDGAGFPCSDDPFPDILKSFVRSLADGSFLPLCLVYIVISLVMLVTGCRRTYSGQVFR